MSLHLVRQLSRSFLFLLLFFKCWETPVFCFCTFLSAKLTFFSSTQKFIHDESMLVAKFKSKYWLWAIKIILTPKNDESTAKPRTCSASLSPGFSILGASGDTNSHTTRISTKTVLETVYCKEKKLKKDQQHRGRNTREITRVSTWTWPGPSI